MSAVCTLGPMRAEQLPRIAELERELFGAQAWNLAMLAEELAEPGRHYTVLSSPDGEITGYAGLARYDDEAHVMTVGVVPCHRRQGLATALVADLLEAAGKRRMILEVGTGNVAAQRLYDGFGFAVIGRRRHYYGPGAHALVMAREATAR